MWTFLDGLVTCLELRIPGAVSSFTFLRCSSSLLLWLRLCSTQESLSQAGERRGTNVSTVSPADQAVPDQQSWKQGPLPSSANTSIPASALALAGNQRCSQDMVHSALFFQ